MSTSLPRKGYVYLGVLFALLATSCSTPAVYQKHTLKTVVISEQPEFTISPSTGGMVFVSGQIRQDIARGYLTQLSEGYRQTYHFGAKLAEMLLLAPIAFAFYPFPLIIPLSFFNPYMLIAPWILLYPGANVIPVSWRSYPLSDGAPEHRLHQSWKHFSESEQVVPFANRGIKVTWEGTTSSKVFITNDKGRAKFHLKELLPKNFTGTQARILIHPLKTNKKYYLSLNQQQINQLIQAIRKE